MSKGLTKDEILNKHCSIGMSIPGYNYDGTIAPILEAMEEYAQQVAKSRAIALLEFIRQDGYEYYESHGWYNDSSVHTFSHEELYELFNQSIQDK